MSVRSHVTPYWNVGRGRRSKFTGKDVMFMVLVVLKNGGAWEMLSNIFHVKTATFIKTITNFVRVVAPRLYDEWVKEKAREESMRMLVTSGRTSGRTFVHHPYALYGTDVTFQQVTGPSTTWQKRFHTTVPSTNFTATKLRLNEAFHHATQRKADEDRTLHDTGLLSAEYPDEWAVFSGQGEPGCRAARALHPSYQEH
ncbi:hypothetical protein PF011_g5315 [Phytophthora fragariae]|uniref:DDE Tnp4 domain-containing protein n=1 Tax=Phytophthora fragariae TaxID=53985 RepID=A0A6A3LR70_9STRA|nr:hypothetical protein PF003_g11840 [Phytophthora fragariae]KAE9020638.1 hypothetical protein PF011_g5315 [Phytophthora fragariae]